MKKSIRYLIFLICLILNGWVGCSSIICKEKKGSLNLADFIQTSWYGSQLEFNNFHTCAIFPLNILVAPRLIQGFHKVSAENEPTALSTESMLSSSLKALLFITKRGRFTLKRYSLACSVANSSYGAFSQKKGRKMGTFLAKKRRKTGKINTFWEKNGRSYFLSFASSFVSFYHSFYR